MMDTGGVKKRVVGGCMQLGVLTSNRIFHLGSSLCGYYTWAGTEEEDEEEVETTGVPRRRHS